MSELSISRFKEVLGHFATGVVVVTAHDDLGPVGFTCQSFAGLSLEPLLATFSAQRSSSSWPRVRESGKVGISILGAEQESIARTFATSGIDKFADVAWRPGANGAPLLADALAIIEGTIISTSAHGDHDIVVLDPTLLAAHSGEPLLYFRGGFGTFAV